MYLDDGRWAKLRLLVDGRRRRGMLCLLLTLGLVLAMASSASALTFGLNWDGAAGTSVERSVELVQKSGATVLHRSLGYVAPGGNWSEDDYIVGEAWKRGVTILPTLNTTTNRFVLVSDPAIVSYGVWARELVERYGVNGSFWSGKANPTPITAWEVFNEPNLIEHNPPRSKASCESIGEHYYAGFETCIQPQAYGEFLKYMAEKIQAGSVAKTSHGTQVLFGGLYARSEAEEEVVEPEGGNKGSDAVTYFLGRAALGSLSSSVTGIALHPYSLVGGATEMATKVTRIHNYLGSIGAGGYSLWLTEIGWPVGGSTNFPTGGHSVSLSEQSTFLTEAFNWIKTNASTDNIQLAAWYNDRDFGGSAWDGYCGLIDQNWNYRPSWYAFQDETGVEHTGTQYTAFQANNKELWWARSDGFYAPTYSGMDPASSPSAAPLPGGGDLMAFQNQLHELWTYSTATGAWVNTGSGMDAGTSPSIANVPGQGFVIAFQDWKHHLWLYFTQTNSWINTELGMLEGTSPSIAADETGGYEVAFQANNNELWYYRSDGFYAPSGLGMSPGTNPSIAALPGGGYDFAFQDWQHNLWTYSTPGGTGGNQKLGLRSGTSPSIAVKPDGSWEIAFQANNGELWYDRSDGFYAPTALGMDAGTSPSIAVTPEGNYSVAFQDWQHNLWTYSSATGAGTNLKLGMEAGTSPSTTIR